MKIVSLIENTSALDMPTEHGLSLYVEMSGVRFLFDAGQTGLFADNARTLGVDLNGVDFAVLSHGHYDHGGGLEAFLSLNDHAPVYVSRHAFEPLYNENAEYIGLDPRLKDSGRIVYVDATREIAGGITLYNSAPYRQIADFSAYGLKMVRDGAMTTDDFRHEQYLLVEEDGKRILFSGCSHRGILNIMHWFRPDVLIGGFHLFRHPLDDALTDTAIRLDAWPTVFFTCHCTGTEQYEIMKRHMRNLHYLSTGESVTI